MSYQIFKLYLYTKKEIDTIFIYDPEYNNDKSIKEYIKEHKLPKVDEKN